MMGHLRLGDGGAPATGGSRLAASVPPPKFHTVRYSGVLASASKLRSRIAPKPPVSLPTTHSQDDKPTS